MNLSPVVASLGKFAIIGIVAIVGATTGCAGGQDATSEALEEAKQLWAKAGIRDYDLDWTVTGTQNNHYYVTVRGGEVLKVESIQPDGKRIVLKPADARYYSVNGLFLTIANELALRKTDSPFGQPKGTTVVMRFKPDPKLGYPQWYRRDVMGTSQALAIDVVKLEPQASSSK